MRLCSLVPLVASIAISMPTGVVALSSALEDPNTAAVLEMIAEAQSEEEILERIDDLAPFPAFDGHDLAELKRRGVSDRVLLRMLELTSSRGAPQPAALTTPRGPTPASTVPAEASLIRVLADFPFDVAYVEFALDGEVKGSRGELWHGSVGAGEHLLPPPDVIVEGTSELFEWTVEPGRYTAAVGFAVTKIRQLSDEVWGQDAGESYDTRGIRATSTFLRGQAPTGNPGVVCSLRAGQLCEIRVTPEYTSSTLLGGASVYSVRYQVSVIDRR